MRDFNEILKHPDQFVDGLITFWLPIGHDVYDCLAVLGFRGNQALADMGVQIWRFVSSTFRFVWSCLLQ